MQMESDGDPFQQHSASPSSKETIACLSPASSVIFHNYYVFVAETIARAWLPSKSSWHLTL
jgi:hypothetical protein